VCISVPCFNKFKKRESVNSSHDIDIVSIKVLTSLKVSLTRKNIISKCIRVHNPIRNMTLNGVERLAVVSKVLFESHILELKRENEALKLKLSEKEKKQWLLEEMFENRFPRVGGREEG
jgi:hypothetical protein